MRDSWNQKTYFCDLIKEIHKVYIDEINGKGDCEDKSRASIAMLTCIRSSFSLGDSVEEIKVHFALFLKNLLLSEECFKQNDDDNKPISLINVRFVSSVIVYGECLGFSQYNLVKMADCIPFRKEQFVDRLLSHYQPDRPISDILKEKGKYKQLIEIMDSEDKVLQAKKIKNYLSVGWFITFNKKFITNINTHW